MLKKEYVSPKIGMDRYPNEMAAPLAIFSAATALAAVGGAVVGAVATSKILGDDIHRSKIAFNREILGLCV